MSLDDQRQQIFQLVALRDVDHRRSETRKLIDSVPRILQARLRQSNGAKQALAAAHEKLLGFKAHLKTLELELSSREEAVMKANGNLLSAKTNQEYTLMQGEIARKREEKGQAEEEVLGQYDVIKLGEQLVEDAKAAVEAALKEYQAFEERALREVEGHSGELAALDARREQIRRAIAPDTLQIYDRAYSGHGDGIVAAEGDICQGCFSKLTPNDRARLMSGKQLMICRTCQRILYLPASLQPAS